MSCFCGLFGRKPAASPRPNITHEIIEEQPRPYSGATAVGTSSTADTVDEKEKEKQVEEKDSTEAETAKRARSRSVSKRLTVHAEALTTALRARSKSRSKSPIPPLPTKPIEEDEKKLPSPRASDEKPAKSSLDNEKTHSKEDDDEKPSRPDLDVLTSSGPAWPLNNDKETKADGDAKWRLSKRTESFDSLDTPISPISALYEKQHLAETLSIINGDSNRGSNKLKDEGLEDDVPELKPKGPETDEQRRKRKMRESRMKLKRETMRRPEEQEDRDAFQFM